MQAFLHRYYTLCNVYLPPSLPGEKGGLDYLVKGLASPFLLLVDMNGCHPHRGDCTTLVEIMELGFLNSGNMTLFHIQTGTFTDVSFCSCNTILDFHWRVISDLHGRDRFPMIIACVG